METAKDSCSLLFTIVRMKYDKCNIERLLKRKCMFRYHSLFKMKGIQNWDRNCLRQETWAQRLGMLTFSCSSKKASKSSDLYLNFLLELSPFWVKLQSWDFIHREHVTLFQ